jgi:hypothetical protein
MKYCIHAIQLLLVAVHPIQHRLPVLSVEKMLVYQLGVGLYQFLLVIFIFVLDQSCQVPGSSPQRIASMIS